MKLLFYRIWYNKNRMPSLKDNAKRKLKAEASSSPKPKPDLPAPGRGPVIDEGPKGPRIDVSKGLQREIVKKSPSAIRGTPIAGSKLRAESRLPVKPKPDLPAPGRGPVIDQGPKGPRIDVSKGLQREILDYEKFGKRSASAIRGVPRSELAQAFQLRLPERVPIRLPESTRPIERPKITVPEATKTVPKGTVTRAQTESIGVKERLGKGVKPPPTFRPDPPRLMQLGPGEIKPKPLMLPARTRPRPELTTIDRVQEYKQKLAARSGNAPAPMGTVKPPVGAQEYLEKLEKAKQPKPPKPGRIKIGVGRGIKAAYAAARAEKGTRAAAAAAALRAPTFLEKAAQGTGKLAKVARGARGVGRVLGPIGVVSDVVTIAEAAKEGYGISQAMQHQREQAGALKKRGYKVTRPELTVSDVVSMVNPFEPQNYRMFKSNIASIFDENVKPEEGFTPAAAEVKNLKIYTPQGKEVVPTVRRRQKKTIKP